jgi:acylphosphatase
MSERIARSLVIRGRVQGVGFRESMRLEAEALGVGGWVRNRLDGTVEALVEGPPDDVEALVRWAHRGPGSARVTGVDQHEAQVSGLGRFWMRPTG